MKYVLFVCTHNAGRSQMAQAFFERDCTTDCRAESAGSQPARQVWPEVVQVMREVGIDLAANKPKRLTVEMQLHADWAVTMGCGDVCPSVPTRVDDWDVPDPAGKSIEEVREIRDLIEDRITDLLRDHIDEIQSDRTSHQWRLAKLLPPLIEEFGDTREPELIRRCTDRILDEYDDVPIRSHIFSLAHKRTRDCLRNDTCDVLEHTSA
jgi:arsenate reductase (thioredoxin)